ncbi:baseplate J/gp47 family protein [Ureibacillus sp. Re31]|uniref:Baseplate J/gp47 family protein n=1 Tax=Ureibacillus galli TaxID=2762222 RepID=A0ABR8XAS1_9BACL|nr:baseplate J/gp47 family protein [Ureibacillus galli]MBD8026414.1 baseplate J/gp47 family protein [Ureibacillus galli]
MLDKNGFKRKTYDDLLTDMSNKARELFGANIKLTQRSFMGIMIRIMAWFLSLAWMAIEQVYHASYIKSAEGVQLDKLLPLAGTERILADYAMGTITITGTPNYTVASGFVVSKGDIQFETLYDLTLDATGKGTVEIMCTQIGPLGNVGANTITEIVNPDADVFSVTNTVPTAGGRNDETDQEARERSRVTVEGMGSGTTASIRTALLGVSGVRAATVIENYSDVADSYGTPSRAFQSFVLGGADDAIASAILEKKAAGIWPYGTTYVEVTDIAGEPHRIGFTRATEVDIYAKVSLTTDAAFPANGVELVKSALVKNIGGTDSNGQAYTGLNMGEKVYYSRGLSAILQVEGIIDVSLLLSDNGTNYSESSIDIPRNSVAQIDASNIEVTVNV